MAIRGLSDRNRRALERAKHGKSNVNYPKIFKGFAAKGIPEEEIIPRVNVLTVPAWNAKGRMIRKDEKGVRVTTFRRARERRDPFTNRVLMRSRMTPSAVNVFHVSQTVEMRAEEF